MTEFEIARRGTVLEFALDRSEKRNALTLPIVDGLRQATEELAQSSDLQVLLVHARGDYFSAGIDLHSALLPDPAIRSPSEFRRWYRSGKGCLQPLGDLWEAVEKPIVVAHQGPCIGGALELSLCADFRLASERATYALPEIAMGGLPGSGGLSRLARLVGPQWTRWLALAGQTVDASRALAMGLVHEVYPADQFETRVREFCDTLAQLPREAFAAGKIAVALCADLGRAEARNVERLAVSGLVMGDEYRAAVENYLAKFDTKTRP